MMRLVRILHRLRRNERGGTAIEYGLIVALVCLAILSAVRGVADENTGMWAQVQDAVSAVM